ncbi:hypothetical protein KI387_015118, partial [Taxus chinensis]
YFHNLTVQGLLPNEAADLAWKVANGSVAKPVDLSDLMKEFELGKVTSRDESLVLKIRSMFSSLDALSINFLPANGSMCVVAGLDMAVLEKFYNSAKELDSKDVVAAIMESTESLLSLDEGYWISGNSIVLRNIITLLEVVLRVNVGAIFEHPIQILWVSIAIPLPLNSRQQLVTAGSSWSVKCRVSGGFRWHAAGWH